jgi:hypothetical protein
VTRPWSAALAICVIAAAGLALTIAVFYPGYMTNDAGFAYEDMKAWRFGDWNSPLMPVLWRLVDPITPGPAGMFLLVAIIYWLAFALIGLTVARRSVCLGLMVPLLGLVPTSFVFLVMIWRDMLFGVVWLLAAAIAYAAAESGTRLRALVSMTALTLVGLGVLLRPNALLAAPFLVTYVLFPLRFSWKRAGLMFVPALAAGFVLVQIVYYGVLGAERRNPLHQVFVFDLGGITHFTGENQFPVAWSAMQTALLTTRCYNPDRWDSYWTIEPCLFVMQRLGDTSDPIFGTPRLRASWMRAIAAHPLAYLAHRAAYVKNLLAGPTLTLELYNLDQPGFTPLAENPRFHAVVALHDWLKPTVLFRLGTWFSFAAIICALASRSRRTPSGAFAVGVTSSAVVYVLTFVPVGIAGDFRYGYWCVLASLAGAAAATAARGERTPVSA